MNNYLKQIYQKPKNEFYEQINNSLKKEKKEFIVTANPETFMISTQDKELEKIILDKNKIKIEKIVVEKEFTSSYTTPKNT